MDFLKEWIDQMRKEELRFFKLLSLRNGETGARKDIQLLDALRKIPKEEPQEEIATAIYGDSQTPAWYRLRNRLLEDLITSLHIQYLDTDTQSRVWKYLSTGRLMIGRSQYELALHLLIKAERLAEKSELYDLLDLVYAELVRLSQQSATLDPEKYVKLRLQNAQNSAHLRETEEVLAVLNYRLRRHQRFGDKGKESLKVLAEVVKKFNRTPELLKSVTFRIRVYQLMSRQLQQQQAWPALEAYLHQTYNEFNQDGIFTRNRQELKLEMLTWWINARYSIGQYAASLQLCTQLENAMQDWNQVAYDKYFVFYLNALVINHVGLGEIKEGIRLLEEMAGHKRMKSADPIHYLYLQVNLGYLSYLSGDFKKGVKTLFKITLTEAYGNANPVLKQKLAIAELILRYESRQSDELLYRAKQIEKDFQKQSSVKTAQRDYILLEILQGLSESDAPSPKHPMMKLAQNWIKKYPKEDNDDIIDHKEWLVKTFSL